MRNSFFHQFLGKSNCLSLYLVSTLQVMLSNQPGGLSKQLNRFGELSGLESLGLNERRGVGWDVCLAPKQQRFSEK